MKTKRQLMADLLWKNIPYDERQVVNHHAKLWLRATREGKDYLDINRRDRMWIVEALIEGNWVPLSMEAFQKRRNARVAAKFVKVILVSTGDVVPGFKTRVRRYVRQ